MAKDVEVQGVDKIVEAMDSLVDPDTIADALGKGCALVERTAKELAPKDNGELRRSITSKVEGNVGIVFTNLE